jgi:hypothetical protein
MHIIDNRLDFSGFENGMTTIRKRLKLNLSEEAVIGNIEYQT